MKSFMDGYATVPTGEYNGLLQANRELVQEVQELKKKLEQAREDLKQANYMSSDCLFCAHKGSQNSYEHIDDCEANEYDCQFCESTACPCAGCEHSSRFLWEGDAE